MELREQIDQIISARKEKGEKLKKRRETLLAMKSALKENCGALTMKVREIPDDEVRAQYIAVFGSMDYRMAQKRIDAALRKMDEGIKRFDRNYISIATVGKERQGKSRFLQSVGDLSNSIIPAYDASSCTGATSIIWNDPQMPRGAVRATITFRQKGEILDIVRPYVDTLDPGYLQGEQLQFEQIADINVTQLSLKMEMGNADQATALKHLTSIVDNFDEISQLFGSAPITLTDPELIKTFVAQNNGKDPEDPAVEYYFRWLAVSRADIYCPFYTNVGRIRLVDTVGIGDTKHGIEQAMLDTVDRECDAAIVVTQPISGIQKPDVNIYNMLRDHFTLRDTGKWLFYLSNHWKGRNDKTVKDFAAQVIDAKWAVADCRVVDSSDQNAVRDEFLMPMLRTLVYNMEDIDRGFLREVDEKEAAAFAEVNQFLANLPALDKINPGSLQGQQAYQKGLACFKRMTSDLRNNVTYWSEEKDKDSGVLWNCVQRILGDLDGIIPSAEQIQDISRKNGNLLPDDVWYAVLHYVRNEITDRFIAIDDALEKATKDFKNSMVECLYEELRSLSTRQNGAGDQKEEEDKVEWLKTMMDGILSGNERYAQIRKAFNFLYQFQFNTRAQLIQEVRRQLYIINPICSEYAKPTVTFKLSDCGESIHFYLTSRMSVIEDELRYHLSKLLRTPNLAFYAAAEEFYDRLTFASDLSGDSLTSMSDVWGIFFQEYSSKIWIEDAKRYEVVNQLIEQYNRMIEKLTACLEGAKS